MFSVEDAKLRSFPLKMYCHKQKCNKVTEFCTKISD